MQKKKKIAFIGTDWNDNEYRRTNKAYGGCSYYRLIKPMELLPQYDVKYFGGDLSEASRGMAIDRFYDKFTKSYDMIIMKNVDNPVAAQAMIHWCTKNKTILVQDFDDNMVLIREDQPAFKSGYGKNGSKRAYSVAMMSLADALIVSTQTLKDFFTDFLKKQFNEDKLIHVFENYNEVHDWDYPLGERDEDKIVIGWAGSITHDADLEMIMPAMNNILLKYPNVHFKLVGGVTPAKVAQLTRKWGIEARKKVSMSYGVSAWDKYPEMMRNQDWDIGLAPLIVEDFNKSKSNIKWMEYAMCDIPTIASNIITYDIIKHGNTGLLANPNQWEEMISRLVENKEERLEIAKNAKKFILKKMQYKQHAKEYQKIIGDIFKKCKK